MVKHNQISSSSSRPAPSSVVNLRVKLRGIVHRHEQMKIAFSNLRSQIKTGLIEAEDVFASLAIPLMKLVGLKTKQMAKEGRSSTIFVDARPPQEFRRNASASQTPPSSSRSQFPAKTRDSRRRIEEQERYSLSKATEVGKRLVEKQRHQLQQLVYLLRRIESNVNTRQDDILQTLDNHRLYLQKLFQTSILYLSSLQQTTQTDEAILLVTHKLLRATFKHVGSALGSVQDGVETLMTELADNMCNPMTDYVRSLKAEMTAGGLMKLVDVVEEMEGMVREGQTELEEAKRKAKVEEERKIEALTRLRDAEEKRRAIIGYLLEAKKKSMKPSTPHCLDEDEKLLWDLLKEKKKVDTQELLYTSPKTRVQAKVTHRPITRSSTKGSGPGTPSSDRFPYLGVSPSVVAHHHKQVSPLLRVREGLVHR